MPPTSFNNTWAISYDISSSWGLQLLKGMKQIYVKIHTYINLKYQLHFSSLVEAVM